MTRASQRTIDPATVDRRTELISGVSEADAPRRRMSIAGIEGAVDARVLSKDFSGPASRLLRLPSGWGTSVPGSFTADIGFFAFRGSMTIGDLTVGELDYVFVPEARVISELRALEPMLVLVFTASPVRYDTAAGGMPARLEVARYADVAWKPLPQQPGRLTKLLWSSSSESVWIGGASQWSYDDGPWHRHDVIEECFVLDGDITFVEMHDSGRAVHRYEAGGYLCRPPQTLHVGPGSGSSADTLTFHRTLGPLTTEWVTLEPDQGESEAESAS